MIAQELLAVFQTRGIRSVDDIAAVDWDEESNRYGVRYTGLIAPMITAIQDLSAQVDAQEQELNAAVQAREAAIATQQTVLADQQHQINRLLTRLTAVERQFTEE